MRLLSVFVFLTALLSADVYYAKVEPFSEYKIKSNVSGQVIFADESLEGKTPSKSTNVVLIDSYIDERDLESAESKKFFLNERLEIIRDSYANLKEVLERKKENYKKFKTLKTKSDLDKDLEFYDLITTENNYLSLRGQTVDIKTQLRDLDTNIATLKKSIKDKKISSNGMYIDELYVKKDDFVNLGTSIMKVLDMSKAKLTVYLTKEDVQEMDNKVIFLDGKPTQYRFNKIWNVADSKYISSYRAELVVEAPERFSKLIKIELRDKPKAKDIKQDMEVSESVKNNDSFKM